MWPTDKTGTKEFLANEDFKDTYQLGKNVVNL